MRGAPELPLEVLEDVFARLPVQVLCRCRAVCKAWNRIITQPRFVACHAQTPCVLISPKMVLCRPNMVKTLKDFQGKGRHVPEDVEVDEELPEMRRDWTILDVSERRFYTLSDSFIEASLEGRNSIWCKRTLAADGGLVYVAYKGIGDQWSGWHHVVCSPLGMHWHEIPKPPVQQLYYKYSNDLDVIVVMSVDALTQRYKIVMVEQDQMGIKEFCVYDAETKHWRSLLPVAEVSYRAWSSVFWRGGFYTLFVDMATVPWLPRLCSCDLETGEWRSIDIKFPPLTHLQDRSNLVVTMGRLFCVTYLGPLDCDDRVLIGTNLQGVMTENPMKEKAVFKVGIWEVVVAKNHEVNKVTDTEYFRLPKRWPRLRPELAVLWNPVVAVGCGESIVISSLVPRRLRFDLRRKRWDKLPHDTLHATFGPKIVHRLQRRDGIYVGILDLCLRETVRMRDAAEAEAVDSRAMSSSSETSSSSGMSSPKKLYVF